MSQFLSQLGWELFRMFARKRTYIGFGIFLVVEILFLYFWTRPKTEKWLSGFVGRLAGDFDEFFSAITLALFIVLFTMLVLGVIFVSLVGGDIVAKETEDGNLRLLLARPVSRFRLLFVKFFSVQIYTTILFWFVGLSALIAGIFERGWGGSFLAINLVEFNWNPLGIYGWWEGIFRYFCAISAFSVMYLPVTGIAFMLSCFKIKPATATITTIAIVMTDRIFSKIPAFQDYSDFFITSRMEGWILIFKQDIPWPQLIESSVWLVGIGLTAFVIGWVAFERRDVKS